MIQVCKEQVTKEQGVFYLWPLARGVDGAGYRERVIGSLLRRLHWTQIRSPFLPLPWVLPQQWHGLFVKDRNHLYFSPVSSLEAGSCASEGWCGWGCSVRTLCRRTHWCSGSWGPGGAGPAACTSGTRGTASTRSWAGSRCIPAHKVPLQRCPWWAGRGSSWRGHGRQAQERRCARSPATSLHWELGELNHSWEALPI